MWQIINYLKHTLKHKLLFWNTKNIKAKLVEYGPTFLIILIIVELIEHLGLPTLFYYLGNNVHDLFYLLIPAPLLICLHFLTTPIIFFIYIYFSKRKKPFSEFFKNTLKLITSISIAQFIPILITPLLTQFFTPEDFGAYGAYISICTIFGIVASGKFDTAIMLPKQKLDAINLLFLSLFMASIFSVIFFSLLNIFKGSIIEITKSKFLYQHYYIIPISIFLISANISITTWLNRVKNYNTIAQQNILKSSSNAFTSLFLGVKNISSGLILGHLTSIILISIWNISYLIKKLNIGDLNMILISRNFKKYIDFFKFSTLSSLFNSFSNLGMTTLIIIFFGPKTAGLYFLAEKLVAIPISFITNSVSQVYFQKASKLFYTNKVELLNLTNKIQKNIFFLIFPILIVATIWGDDIFSIFGNEWKQAGIILKYFTAFILLKNLYSPISHIGDILSKQKLLLIFNVSLFLCQLITFYFFKDCNNIKPALLTASFLGAIHYLILNIYMKKELIKKL